MTGCLAGHALPQAFKAFLLAMKHAAAMNVKGAGGLTNEVLIFFGGRAGRSLFGGIDYGRRKEGSDGGEGFPVEAADVLEGGGIVVSVKAQGHEAPRGKAAEAAVKIAHAQHFPQHGVADLAHGVFERFHIQPVLLEKWADLVEITPIFGFGTGFAVGEDEREGRILKAGRQVLRMGHGRGGQSAGAAAGRCLRGGEYGTGFG